MKLPLVFLIVATLLPSMYCRWTNAELGDKLKGIRKECIKTAPVTKNVMAKLNNLELVDDETLKKYTYCLLRGQGFIDANGRYDANVIKEKQAKLVHSHRYDKLLDDCTQNPILNDAVASGWKFMRCIQREGTGHEFEEMVQFYYNS